MEATAAPAAGNKLLEWPEPIIRVQKLAETGIIDLPPRYIRPPEERPAQFCNNSYRGGEREREQVQVPPLLDLSAILECDGKDSEISRQTTMQLLSSACMEWGVFQVVNHGIPHDLLASALVAARGFFQLPMEDKLVYANDPMTYEGYGSRMGVQKGIILDWGDYFFHHVHPLASRNEQNWPTQPPDYRRIINVYCDRVLELCKTMFSLFSESLGLPRGTLFDMCGGEELGLCFRMNYYSKCPQPELALGLSAHTDPGSFTILLQDQVCGLQVKKEGTWISVPPIKDAFVVLIGDQLEILSNGMFKSVEHRTTVNKERERMSLVVFCNPDGRKRIGPIENVVERSGNYRLYQERTFNEYRMFIRTLGGKGKTFLDFIKQADNNHD